MNQFKILAIFIILANLTRINGQSIVNSTEEIQTPNQILYEKRHDKSILFLNYNWIVFKDKVQKCRMYIESCEFNFLLKKSIQINELNLTSSDESTFKIVSIQLCNDTTNSSDCNSIVDYFKDEEKRVNYTEFNVYKIIYKPVLVGFSAIEFRLLSTEIILFDIIITEPRRFVDYVFDVFIYGFGITISTLMGVLLDKKSLVEIAKMPIPVVIGFCCQYLCMPLVRVLIIIN